MTIFEMKKMIFLLLIKVYNLNKNKLMQIIYQYNLKIKTKEIALLKILKKYNKNLLIMMANLINLKIKKIIAIEKIVHQNLCSKKCVEPSWMN